MMDVARGEWRGRGHMIEEEMRDECFVSKW